MEQCIQFQILFLCRKRWCPFRYSLLGGGLLATVEAWNATAGLSRHQGHPTAAQCGRGQGENASGAGDVVKEHTFCNTDNTLMLNGKTFLLIKSLIVINSIKKQHVMLLIYWSRVKSKVFLPV